MCVAVGGAVGGPGGNCPEARVSSLCGAAACGVAVWASAVGARAGAASNMGRRAENSRRFIGPRIRGSWYAMRLSVRKWASEANEKSSGRKQKRLAEMGPSPAVNNRHLQPSKWLLVLQNLIDGLDVDQSIASVDRWKNALGPFDSVIWAVGRTAATAGMGLD